MKQITSGTPTLDAIASTRDFVDTQTAAQLLGRQPQTLRKWSCTDKGPIRPHRVFGRLLWRVQEIITLLRGEGAAIEFAMQ